MTEQVRLRCGEAEAAIATMGAEPVSWLVAGRDLLWTANPAIWDQTSPVLFPIVGRAAHGVLSIDGQSWPMTIHGFAAASRFTVIEKSADAVRLRLTDDEHTRARFPFAFALEVAYRLTETGLAAEFEVANTGPRTLPYALGLHPGFAWPLPGAPREGHRIVFDRDERAEVPVITPAGLFSPQRRPIPLDGRTLELTDALMSNEALCFLDVRGTGLRFVAPDGSWLGMEVEDFPHVALWTRPPAPYLCIEAWTGHGDPDGFTGDIFDKPSMRKLPPGAVARHAVRYSYSAAR